MSPNGFLDPSGSVEQISTQLVGESYFCVLAATVVSCTAAAPEAVPNLEDMPGQPWGPFTGRPSAVSITGGDITWGMIEGGPAGCGSGGTSFTVSGPNRTFSQP